MGLPHDDAMHMETSRTVRTRAPRYDGPENRRRVLEAALDVFSQMGYEAASTRAIAAAAGIEQGHLAYYFPNKMALWQRVIETFAQDAEASLRDQLPRYADLDTAATAKAVLPGLLHVFANNPRLTRLMLQEFSVTSDRSAWLTENFAKPVWLLLQPLFERLREQGYLGGAAAEIAYFSFIGSALIVFGNTALIQQFSASDPSAPDWIDQAISHILRSCLVAA